MSSLTDLLARYGYSVIALFLFIESIGVPIPGESALVTAAALAGRGRMSIAWVFLAAVVGTVSGGMSGYWIGVRGGHAIVGHFGRALRIDDQRLDRARIFFERHGASALLVFPSQVFSMGGQLRPEMAVPHLSTIAAATDLPLIVFAYAERSTLSYPLDTLVRMAEAVPSIRAIKDWSNDPMLH